MQKQQNRNKIIIRITLFLIIIAMTIFIMPPPVYVMAPGETKSTYELIQFEKQQEAERNKTNFYYTTVLLKQTNWSDVFKSFTNPNETAMLKNQVLQGRSLETYKAIALLSMRVSFNEALEAAYKHMNVSYNKQSSDLYVYEARSSSSFFAGDKIVGIITDKVESDIESEQQFLEQVNLHLLNGEQMTIVVENGHQTRTVAMSNDKKLLLPLDIERLAKWLKVKKLFTLTEVVATDATQRLQFGAEKVGGASAGLVIALTVIDELESNMIESESKIAATGTITVDGKVGIIGGIEQKVAAINETNIDLFIVPQEQLEIAQKKAESINSAVTIVGVSTLAEAIETIKQFNK